MGTKDNRRKSHLIIGLSLSLSLACGGLSYGSYKMNNLERDILKQSKTIDAFKAKTEEYESLTNQQKKEIKTLTNKNITLAQSLEKQKSEFQTIIHTKDKEIGHLKEENKKVSIVPSRGETSKYKQFYVEASGYIALCEEGCSGKTATGFNLIENPNAKVIAVDPKVIPLGTKVYVDGYGYAVAADTGGAIKGYKIDLFFPQKQTALNWGRKKVKIKVYQ